MINAVKCCSWLAKYISLLVEPLQLCRHIGKNMISINNITIGVNSRNYFHNRKKNTIFEILKKAITLYCIINNSQKTWNNLELRGSTRFSKLIL